MNISPRNFALGLLAAVAFSIIPAFAGPPKVGDAFPSLASATLEGSVPDLKGKVVLVDFWASWCGPCKAAFPALKEVHAMFKDKGVVVLGVSLDEDKADMDAFVKKSGANFPIVRDAKGKLAAQLNVESIPTTYILDANGKVAAIHSGFGGEATKREYIAEIERLLAAK
jgi:cytochrome c biogenesis protein CcmG/thiol:disulfide interchange protein DsbE